MTDFNDCEFYSTEEDGPLEHESPEEAIGERLCSWPADDIDTVIREACPLTVFGWVRKETLTMDEVEAMEDEGWHFVCKIAAKREYSADECREIMRLDYPELFE